MSGRKVWCLVRCCKSRHISERDESSSAVTGKLLTALVAIGVVGYDMARKLVSTPSENDQNAIKITKRWYTHTLAFGNTSAVFFGPFLFNIFLQKVYNDPETSEGMRLALANVRYSRLVLDSQYLCTIQLLLHSTLRNENHCVEKPHHAHKAIFIPQMVYSATSQWLSEWGPTDLVYF